MSRFLCLVFFCCVPLVLCCTNFLVSKGASKDGSAMITYADDSHTRFGFLERYPAADHPAGSMREIYDWGNGEYRGSIPEVAHTYSVIGNMNEHAVAIGETTFGGVSILSHQTGAILDYGSLIYLTLQRAKTAREAIQIFDSLANTYGYASSGESLSIADQNEVWIFEVIGRGEGERGLVYVAQRVPEGMVCAHANQARIRTFPRNDSANCLYSPDIVSFARRKGLYNGTSEDAFSFSDVFAPLTFENARAAEARVWSFFRHVAGAAPMDPYLDYAQGYNLKNRMPLFMRPLRLLSVIDLQNEMRDHFEGTWLDFRTDAGAQAFQMPYRWRPLDWNFDGHVYVNERSTGTQQTAWSFVAQIRPAPLPKPIAGILHFGLDDTAFTVYTPMYCGIQKVPPTFASGNGDLMTFSFTSAFWMFNLVANYAYQRYSLVYPEIRTMIDAKENQYQQEIATVDTTAAQLYETDPQAALDFLTDYSVHTGDQLTTDWLAYWQQLFVKYMDGNVKTKNPGHRVPIVKQPGYPQVWLDRIATETGDHYKAPKHENAQPRKPRMKGI
eukprot:TRINITY_DN716_c0_g1_i1.p1 TRINITY_DN716_c0_g1~~TRINITY_DN716_c0_g1_i1.p1  ORF type:complete len:556 (+),score=127.12 TRINITY_DN716_c0_g1_i1:23-1690(+)